MPAGLPEAGNRGAIFPAAPGGYGCSFAVITIVEEAHEHFLRLVEAPQVVEREGLPWTIAQLPSADNATHLVVEGQAPARSLLPAQVFAAKMLKAWSPRSLVVADCGGGIKRDSSKAKRRIELCDVVVADRLEYYELQKLESSGDGADGKRTPIYIDWQPMSIHLRTMARELDRLAPTWRDRLTAPRPEPDRKPQIKLGEIVCGDKLLGDEGAAEVDHINTAYPRALAVDMETVAIAHAVLSEIDEGLGLSFVALRGISDWIDRGENQQTRDRWKNPACEAAIAAAIALISATPATVVDPVATDSRRRLRKRLQSRYAIPEKPYESRIEMESKTLTRNDVLTVAADGDGAVLVGDAGVGKSSVMHHAALGSTSPLDPFPVLVDLKRWRPEYGKRLAADPSGPDLLPSLDTLLRASVQRIGVEPLDQIASQQPVMLFVDGLNEVPFTEVGQRILTLLDEYMRARPNVRVLATDRTAGQFYDDNGWQVMRLQPLDSDEVRRVVAEELGSQVAGEAEATGLLRIPFFLDRALRGGKLALASRAAAVEEFFVGHVGVEGAALRRLASAAFDVYMEGRRTFSAANFESLCGAETFKLLRQAGAVVGDEELSFEHQIEHDFLAARHLGLNPSLWTATAFDAVTFETAAFEVLGLTLEQLPENDLRDTFLRCLHDWNWRGTLTALAAAERDGSTASSAPLRTALLAVIAEKQFDPVSGTRDRSSRQLENFAGELPAAMRRTATVKDLVELIAKQEGALPWFQHWQAMFCRMPEGGPLTERELALVGDADPVIGWTSANVVRRFRVDPGFAAQLRELYAKRSRADTADRAVRWRVVHALGAWPGAENVATLQHALDDEYMWVTYGAVRSLVEIAATTGDVELRDQIVSALTERLTALAPEPLSQIAYASRHIGASIDFARVIRPLLDRILAQQANESERRLWTARIERFDAFWRQQTNPGGGLR